MLHSAPVQQRHEARHVVERAARAERRNFSDRRLQIPEDVRGFILSHWQQSLASRHQARAHLVKIRENSAIFVKRKYGAYQAKRRRVMNQTLRFEGSLASLSKLRKIAQRNRGLQKIAA